MKTYEIFVSDSRLEEKVNSGKTVKGNTKKEAANIAASMFSGKWVSVKEVEITNNYDIVVGSSVITKSGKKGLVRYIRDGVATVDIKGRSIRSNHSVIVPINNLSLK